MSEDQGRSEAEEKARGLLPRSRRHEFDEELRRRSQKDELQDAAGEFLLRFRWDLIAHLTFAHPRSREGAHAAVRDWLEGFGGSAYAYAVCERGPHNGRTHAHVLVGGLRRKNRFTTIREEQWPYGRAEVDPFKADLGGSYYLSKETVEWGMGQFLGEPRAYRPKRRG